jgi:hypothetical protein
MGLHGLLQGQLYLTFTMFYRTQKTTLFPSEILLPIYARDYSVIVLFQSSGNLDLLPSSGDGVEGTYATELTSVAGDKIVL